MFGQHNKRVVCLAAFAALSLVLGGCETMRDARKKVDDNMITRDETTAIAEQPLKDFNVMHDEVPQELQVLVTNPYAPPKPYRCDTIQRELVSLRVLIGPDFDEPHDPNAGVTRGKLLDMAEGTASSWIPFRNVVRWATGADRHQREMKRAILAGQVRRAYLKGIGAKLNCQTTVVDRQTASRSSKN